MQEEKKEINHLDNYFKDKFDNDFSDNETEVLGLLKGKKNNFIDLNLSKDNTDILSQLLNSHIDKEIKKIKEIFNLSAVKNIDSKFGKLANSFFQSQSEKLVVDKIKDVISNLFDKKFQKNVFLNKNETNFDNDLNLIKKEKVEENPKISKLKNILICKSCHLLANQIDKVALKK